MDSESSDLFNQALALGGGRKALLHGQSLVFSIQCGLGGRNISEVGTTVMLLHEAQVEGVRFEEVCFLGLLYNCTILGIFCMLHTKAFHFLKRWRQLRKGGESEAQGVQGQLRASLGPISLKQMPLPPFIPLSPTSSTLCPPQHKYTKIIGEFTGLC